MKTKSDKISCIFLFSVFCAPAFAQKAIITLPSLEAEVAELVTVPVTVTTDSLISFAQFVVEYDANVLRFDHVENGKDAAGFTLLAQPDLPFPSATPGTNENVLAQVSSAAQHISGNGRVAVNFYFEVTGNAGDSSALIFDTIGTHTVLSTRSGKDLSGNDLHFVNGVVRVSDTPSQVLNRDVSPSEFILEENYPNPFNPETTIQYQLARDGRVTLVVYGLLGQRVKVLVDDEKQAGNYTVMWNGTDESGRQAGSGVYVVQMSCDEFSQARKLLLLK